MESSAEGTLFSIEGTLTLTKGEEKGKREKIGKKRGKK
jgi:hypothetical protein